MQLAGKKMNFLGDSITEGHGVSCVENRFTDIIAREENAIVRNYGIGGTRFAKQINPSIEPKWDQYFAYRFKEMDPDADIVVIFGGTNDFGHGDAPIGRMSDRTADTFYGAAHCLFAGVRERYPDATIVIITPMHRLEENLEDGTSLKDYVEIIREVAQFYSLPVLDLFKNSGIQPCLPVIQEKFMPDGLHPNDAGHKIIANQIVSFLKAL